MSNTGSNLKRGTRYAGLVGREVIGWMLIACGLYVFRACFQYLNSTPSQFVESMVAAAIGGLLFRGGLQLVKVAVAARAYERASTPQAT